MLLLFYFLLSVLKLKVGNDFNVTLREHDLCEHVAGNKRLDHLTKVLVF